jgi:two-component system, NtrC family, sensor kinase
MSQGAATDVESLDTRERAEASGPRPRRRRVRRPKFDTLSWQILSLSEIDIPRAEFLTRVAGVIAAHSGIPSVEICLRERRRCSLASAEVRGPERTAARWCDDVAGSRCSRSLCATLLDGRIPADQVSPGGSLMLSSAQAERDSAAIDFDFGQNIKTALLVPFAPQSGQTGLLVLRSRRSKKPWPLEVELYESLAHLIGVALAQRSSQRALRERVKELTYLYRISELFSRPDTRVEEITQQSPQLVAHGCPVPGPVIARVRVDDLEAWWPEREGCAAGLASEIVVQGRVRGRVEVRCKNWRPEHAEEWERDEAQRFLDAVAGALATALHRSALRAEKDELKAQVQHTERLATIGTLMAVLAHEVNEPLSTINGFTELVQKDSSLSDGARADLERVASAGRHVKGVVRKLLSFAGASEPSWQPISLNQAVEDGISFIEPSCSRAGVRIVRRLDLEIGSVLADHEQLCQIVVNLGMNAVHAMPDGGTLTIETKRGTAGWTLVVADSGAGISEEVKQRMFQPFFTTRGRERGLGLGLAVVQGIVSSHGGSLEVESELGKGARITVRLPLRPPSAMDGVTDGHDAG